MNQMKKFFLFLLIISLISIPILYVFAKETYFYLAPMQLSMLFLALFLLFEKDLQTTLKKVGFPGNLKSNLLYFAAGIIVLFAILLIIGIISLFLGINDQTKVASKVESIPLLQLILFASLLAPFCEEFLFRGFLQNRFGILISAIIFSLLHFGYGSISEILGTFAIGLFLSFLRQKSNSITPGILIHMVYNFLAIIVMRFFL
jgi:membrane protease YdiL (CAAX protease family)